MTSVQTAVRFGRFLLQRDRRVLLVDGEPAKLGARAFDVLIALVDRGDRVVGKSELLDLVWPNLVVEENNLQVHISVLRKLMGPQAIATIPGRGYRFTLGPVESVPAIGSMSPRVAAAQLSRSQAASAAAGAPSAEIVWDREALTNLPAAHAVLFGRAADSDTVRALLEQHRLVSLIGPGGIGKSSLALQVAERCLNDFGDGVWLIELAPLTSGELVPIVIAAAFKVQLATGVPVQQALVDAFKYRDVLLVLDNCEHLVNSVVTTIAGLLAGCPGVRILATSQELLRLSEEHAYRVAPLTYPAAGEASEPLLFSAVELFTHRVHAIDRSFAMHSANVAGAGEICRRLDGIPLAIEMAAARVPLLGVQGVRSRLDERFRLLKTGSRAAPGRQHTMQATLEWSHSHLSEPERVVFRRLGIFAGGFPLQAMAEVVADGELDEWDVIDRLGSLVEKSLVVAEGSSLPRYRLLETMRAYALEQLAAAGETRVLKQRHAGWITRLCEELDDVAPTSRTFQWQSWLLPELDNVRAALDWAFGDDGDPLSGMKLTGYAVHLLALNLSLNEGRRWFEIALSRVDSETPAEIEALLADVASGSAFFLLDEHRMIEEAKRAAMLWQGRHEGRHLRAMLRQAGLLAVLRREQESEAILASVKERLEPWPALSARYWNIRVMMAHTSPQAAEAAYHRARTLFDQIGNAAASVIATANFARNLFMQGETKRPEAELRSVLERAQDCGNAGVTSHVIGHLARVLIFQGRVDEAEPLIRQSLQLLPKLNYLFWLAPELALRAAWRGQWETAARLSGYAAAAYARSGMRENPRTPIEKRLNEMLAQHLDAERTSVLRREGAAWTEPEVLAAAGAESV